MSIGVIGGTGLYALSGFSEVESRLIETPFGSPSSPVTIAARGDVEVCFIARHGESHAVMPGQVNYRANVWALKSLGCTKLLSIGAVGSLRDQIRPGDFCVPDQFIDKTFLRATSFFDIDISAYVSMAEPFCPSVRKAVCSFLSERSSTVHEGGTYVVMEGPQLSTRAESNMHQLWGGDVIGMTLCPEAKLAREAEIAYCPLAMVSDYDCWHETEECVTAESALAVLGRMSEEVMGFLPELIDLLHRTEPSEIAMNALGAGLVTDLSSLSKETRHRLKPILQRYLPA